MSNKHDLKMYEKKILCQHRWMSLGVGDRGEPFIHIDGDGVFIVPVTDHGEVWMIVEPSVTTKEPILGLPAGTIEADEAIAEAANRELQEEIGYRSEKLDYLGAIKPLARHSNLIIHVFFREKIIALQDGR